MYGLNAILFPAAMIALTDAGASRAATARPLLTVPFPVGGGSAVVLGAAARDRDPEGLRHGPRHDAVRREVVSPLERDHVLLRCRPELAVDRGRVARPGEEVLQHADVMAGHPLAEDAIAHVLRVTGIVVTAADGRGRLASCGRRRARALPHRSEPMRMTGRGGGRRLRCLLSRASLTSLSCRRWTSVMPQARFR